MKGGERGFQCSEFRDSGAGEPDDTSTFNKANEILTRDTDTNSSVNYTLTHNAVGQLTDDGQSYKYEYDAFGRLRKVKNQSSTLRAEYRYNGLGHRIGWHYDVDADGTVEDSADDPWFYFAYDEAWRMVAMYQAAETSPKEVFVNHMAGPRGFGGSSKLDDVILRDRNSDRVCFCQNWRGDVVALVAPTGYRLKQMVRYSAFGVPYGLPQGDTNGDCAVDSSDQFEYPWTAGYDPRFDIDLDGDIDISDWSILDAAHGTTWGRGVLSSNQNNGNPGLRKGYAGYEHDGVFTTTCHVRNRVLLTELGRLTRRDPLGYVDGMGLYAYVGNRATTAVDTLGLRRLVFDEFAAPLKIEDEVTGGGPLPCPNSLGIPCMAGCGGSCHEDHYDQCDCDAYDRDGAACGVSPGCPPGTAPPTAAECQELKRNGKQACLQGVTVPTPTILCPPECQCVPRPGPHHTFTRIVAMEFPAGTGCYKRVRVDMRCRITDVSGDCKDPGITSVSVSKQ